MQATSPVLDPGMFTSSILSPTISVHLGGQQLHWLSQHAQALLRWGWRWSVSSAAGSMVEVQQAPFILGKHVQAAELQVRPTLYTSVLTRGAEYLVALPPLLRTQCACADHAIAPEHDVHTKWCDVAGICFKEGLVV